MCESIDKFFGLPKQCTRHIQVQRHTHAYCRRKKTLLSLFELSTQQQQNKSPGIRLYMYDDTTSEKEREFGGKKATMHIYAFDNFSIYRTRLIFFVYDKRKERFFDNYLKFIVILDICALNIECLSFLYISRVECTHQSHQNSYIYATHILSVARTKSRTFRAHATAY